MKEENWAQDPIADELVTMRQAVAGCIRDADHGQDIAALDSEIDAFNDLLASRCSG